MKDFDTLKSLWAQRKKTQLADCVTNRPEEAGALILASPSDWGVCRNGGRRGSRFAPQAIAHVLKKMVAMPEAPALYFEEVSCGDREQQEFVAAQEYSGKKIGTLWEEFVGENVFHLGGGHDHIFPLLISLKGEKAIHVINIDAHLDTRAEPLYHSGTPFRQFAEQYRGRFRLTQLGIHPFANDPSSYRDMPAEMTIFSPQDVARDEEVISFREDEVTLLSLDCDAIAAESMEAVSAVNPAGISAKRIRKIFELYRQRVSGRKIYGIYEYNPIYDNLSQKGARLIASLIYGQLTAAD